MAVSTVFLLLLLVFVFFYRVYSGFLNDESIKKIPLKLMAWAGICVDLFSCYFRWCGEGDGGNLPLLDYGTSDLDASSLLVLCNIAFYLLYTGKKEGKANGLLPRGG